MPWASKTGAEVPTAPGSLGIARLANLNREGDYPSMFEPERGSAPDIAGRGLQKTQLASSGRPC